MKVRDLALKDSRAVRGGENGLAETLTDLPLIDVKCSDELDVADSIAGEDRCNQPRHVGFRIFVVKPSLNECAGTISDTDNRYLDFAHVLPGPGKSDRAVRP